MTATFFLIRHASHDLLGKVLVGRMPGVTLSATGQMEAKCAGERLSRQNISVLQTSPVERARATAALIGERCGLDPAAAQALTEIDFGDWTGRTFADLRHEPGFQKWNAERSAARPPGGEAMTAAQARIVAHMETCRTALPQGRIALVGHADLIKAAIAFYLGLSLDLLARFEIDPASISTLAVGDWGAKILRLNEAACG